MFLVAFASLALAAGSFFAQERCSRAHVHRRRSAAAAAAPTRARAARWGAMHETDAYLVKLYDLKRVRRAGTRDCLSCSMVN